MSENWLLMSACDLGRNIESGKIDPRDLTEVFISAIQDHPYSHSIFARLTEFRAREEAKSASERSKMGLRKSKLDGVPISWKDLFDTGGVATEAGSALLAGRVPEKDAEVLRRGTALGLICLGKTHLSELAFSGLGLNPITASPPCINDHESVSGGSSSGAAASVAFGLSAAGIGSDTGGSVRVPAAWNDLVGLKPTSGQLPLEGVVQLCAKFDTVGPLTRTVEDAAALFAIMSGSSNSPCLGQESLAKMRFLVAEDVMENVRDQPMKGFDNTIEALRKAGAELIFGSLSGISRVTPLAGCLYEVEAYAEWGDMIEADPDKMFAMIRKRFQSGKNYSGTDYVKACKTLNQVRTNYWAKTTGYDAVLLPTSPILPPKYTDVYSNSELYIQENLLALSLTRIGNLLEVPALTLPTGVPSTGLMIFGHPNAEMSLLRVGFAVERALDLV